MKKNKKIIFENEIIFKYLKKLNFNKPETFDFNNDGAFLKTKKNKEIIVTNDAIVEGIDFFKKDPPESIAQKIINYNLSDLSSMGAIPYCYSLTLSLNNNIDELWISKFTNKLYNLQKKNNFFLLGGDISKSSQLNISANFFGYVKRGKILKRDISKIGDSIWITGNIGQSYIGLITKQKKIIIDKKSQDYFLKKYLFPEACLIGSQLTNIANSCIDISDGFIGDLSKLLESSKGAELYISKIPISNNAKILISKNIVDFNSLLNAGDDYELIFTCSPKNDQQILKLGLKNRIKISKVGRIIEGHGILVDGEKLKISNNSFQYYF